MLPYKLLAPEDLESFIPDENSKTEIYIVVFPPKNLYARKSDEGFDRKEYELYPDRYKSIFAEKYAKYLSVIFNCLYYETRYPRVLTIDDISKLDKLLGICDITCDLNGTIQVCSKFTTPEEPFFLYRPFDNRMYELCKSHVNDTILYYSMDFLPTELPYPASTHLSHCLLGYLEGC